MHTHLFHLSVEMGMSSLCGIIYFLPSVEGKKVEYELVWERVAGKQLHFVFLAAL